MDDKPKPKNPFFKRIKHLNEVPSLTGEEVNLALWGDKDGPKDARQLSQQPPQGGERG